VSDTAPQLGDQSKNSGVGLARAACYPLLESLLQQLGLSLLGVYTVQDVAKIFRGLPVLEKPQV
jgi:hypothetical protein